MAVAIDATGTEAKSGTAVTSFNFTGLTVGAGLSNSAILVMLSFDANVSALSATWGAQTLTRIGTGVLNGTLRSEMFGGVAPTSGNQTLALAWTTASQVAAQAISVTGANQTGGTTTFAHSNTATSSASNVVSVAITSATGDMVAAAVVTTVSFNVTPFVITNGTLVNSYTDTTPANISAAGAWATETASPVTVKCQFNTNGTNAIIGVEIVAAAAASIIDTLGSPIFRVQAPAWR